MVVFYPDNIMQIAPTIAGSSNHPTYFKKYH